MMWYRCAHMSVHGAGLLLTPHPLRLPLRRAVGLWLCGSISTGRPGNLQSEVASVRVPGKPREDPGRGLKLGEVVHCWPCPRVQQERAISTSQPTVWPATVLSTPAGDSEKCDCM